MKNLFFGITIIMLFACKNNPDTQPDPIQEAPVQVPAFSKDSAFAHIASQVAFGPRVPGSKGHDDTRVWLVNKLKQYGAKVSEQSFRANTTSIGQVRGVNIIGSFQPNYTRRVLLAAHWDTRYAADEDETRMNEPIEGADDGGSGVGVLLEIARLISENPLPIGIDIVFFDVEDQGTDAGGAESWCLGAQFWAQNPHVKNYRAEFGILLDMVGAQNAVFQREDLTGVFPPAKVQRIHQHYDKLWNMARGMGKSAQFATSRTRPVTDDHFFVNYYTDIPMIDIIHKPLDKADGFGPHWHTHKDVLDNIDPNILGTVGQVVTAYLYHAAKPNM